MIVTEITKGPFNYYGTIWIKQENGSYYWAILQYEYDLNEKSEWQKIPYELYHELLKFNSTK